MRIKASYPQRVVMLLFMVAVGLWAAWPDWMRVGLVLLAAIAAGLWLLLPARQQ
jgi:hypothetical protein